jgi:hypothetical protein
MGMDLASELKRQNLPIKICSAGSGSANLKRRGSMYRKHTTCKSSWNGDIGVVLDCQNMVAPGTIEE